MQREEEEEEGGCFSAAELPHSLERWWEFWCESASAPCFWSGGVTLTHRAVSDGW